MLYIMYTSRFVTVYFINRPLAKGEDRDPGDALSAAVREPADRE